MKFLLDTHFVIWIPAESRRISLAARKILNDPANEFAFSAASLMEIQLKRERNKPDFEYDSRLLRKSMLANGYEELPITGEHALELDSLPPIHKDPFDRLLIAQAVVEGIVLLTADKAIARYPGPIKKV